MEVALAATVLALTLTGMIGVIESGSQVLDLSRKQTIAEQLLHGEVDYLRTQTWVTITSSPYAAGPTTLVTTGGNADTVLIEFWPIVGKWRNFKLLRTITCIQPTSNPYPYASTPMLLQVTFTAQWTGMNGKTYYRNSTTFLSYDGLDISYQRS
jgi:hypothetical protein